MLSGSLAHTNNHEPLRDINRQGKLIEMFLLRVNIFTVLINSFNFKQVFIFK